MLTLIIPFLIKPTVPTSSTADRPVSALSWRGPIFGLTIPCDSRSPHTKFANLTRRSSTTFTGVYWTNVMPNRIISFVITCTCKHITHHINIFVRIGHNNADVYRLSYWSFQKCFSTFFTCLVVYTYFFLQSL